MYIGKMGKTYLVVLQFLKAFLFFLSGDWLHATIELNTESMGMTRVK